MRRRAYGGQRNKPLTNLIARVIVFMCGMEPTQLNALRDARRRNKDDNDDHLKPA